MTKNDAEKVVFSYKIIIDFKVKTAYNIIQNYT